MAERRSLSRRVSLCSLVGALMTAVLAYGGDSLATAGLIALVAVFVWVTLGRKPSMEIVVRDGRVASLRGVAKAQSRRVTEFLERDVAFNGDLKVRGGRDANGVLRISFRGDIDRGTQQQIRNYLKMVL